ncbi:MAG: hypothetical protein PVF43_06490 [Candidatus Eiseniibacteriota bacterium]|jgi:hypothetical protein
MSWFSGARPGIVEGSSTAAAFIETLDPGAGFVTTHFITVDMTSTPATWSDCELAFAIDPSLDGQIFQFGFLNVATYYEGSGIFYDSIDFYVDSPGAMRGGLHGAALA